ncbi:hypothetical protein [Sphingomonas faeni]|uniref:hypothetical protein n=1 Tax=Sphingomonas faeni TaxID=185950 RepID=UPI003354F28E
MRVNRHAFDKRRQDLCSFAAERLGVERLAQAADILFKQLQQNRMRQDRGRRHHSRQHTQLSFQSRFLCLAVAKELQQGRGGHRCKHVCGQHVDLAGDDGEAVDDRLVMLR